MNRFLLLFLVVLAACDASPLSLPDHSQRRFTDHQDAPLIVLMEPQSVQLELAGGETVADARFSGRMLAGEAGSAQMDGAILVVSALDGPMPNQPRDRWVQAIFFIREATSDESDVIRFAGAATLYLPDGERLSFEVTGLLTVDEAKCRTCPARIEIFGDVDYEAAAGPVHWQPQVSLFDVSDEVHP